MSHKDENKFEVVLPFKHMNKDHNEITINSKNIMYGEACEGYGMQLTEKGEKNRDKVKEVCFEISKKFKELDKLINN